MAIMTRIINIFKADLHGVMDQLEDQGLLLKQHLRDMEDALNCKQAKLKKMVAARNHSRQEYGRYKRQWEALDQDLEVAVCNKKDDIARMLIKKMKPLEDFCDELSRHIKTLDEDITRFKNHQDQQRLQYEQLKHRSIEYFHNVERQEWKMEEIDLIPDNSYSAPSEQEIELELLKRKEALGVTT